MPSNSSLLSWIASICLATTVGAQDLAIERGPYLQNGSAHSVLISWTTPASADSVVEFGKTPDYGSEVSSSDLVLKHDLLLTGLEPATRYFYRVSGNGEVLAGGKSFVTFPPEAQPGKLDFVVFGDSGTGIPEQYQVADGVAAADADFLLHVGDFVYPRSVAEDWDDVYFGVYAEIISERVLFPVPGNKDVDDDDGENYFAVFSPPGEVDPPLYYSFTCGDALVVVLNSNADFSGGNPQVEFLDRELSSTERTWKFVALHHPIYSSLLRDAPATRALLEPLFEKHGVDLVFQGHNHFFERTHPILGGEVVNEDSDPDYVDTEGTIYIVTGGGGGILATATPKSFSARYVSTYHHTRVSLRENRLTLVSIASDGRTLDTMTLSKTPGMPPLDRGDVNGDGSVDIGDVVALLFHLFVSAPAPACPPIGDANADGETDSGDVIHLLAYLYLGGPAPSKLSAEEADRCGFSGPN